MKDLNKHIQGLSPAEEKAVMRAFDTQKDAKAELKRHLERAKKATTVLDLITSGQVKQVSSFDRHGHRIEVVTTDGYTHSVDLY